MKAKELLHTIINLHRQQPITASILWVYAALLSGVVCVLFLPSSPPFWFAAYAFIIGCFSFIFLAITLQALVVRIRTVDGGPDWDAMVNGVTAGQISDATYASIRRDALLDYRNYLAQLWNYLHVALRIVNDFLVVIPAFLFWVAVAYMVFAPGDFAQAVLAIQKITPGMVAASASAVYQMLASLFIIFIGVLLVVGRPFGFINRFDEAVSNGVRRAVSCSTTGDVFLVRFEEPWECRAIAPLKKIKTKAGEVVHP